MAGDPDGKTYAAFLAAVVIGGSNFIAVTFSNREMAPMFGAMVRFAMGAILFLAIARAMRVPPARGRSAWGAALYGVLGFGAAYALLYYALVGLAAGTAAVILAAVPLVTLVIAVLTGQEKLSGRAIAGGLLVIAGIGVLSWGTLGGDLGLSYLLASVAGTVAIAGSSVVAKAYPDVHPLNMNGIGMAAGTILLLAGSLLFGETWALPRETETLLALTWLVLLGSLGLFQLFLYVIRKWTASATVYIVSGMPVVAVLLGALMLDQPITLEVVAGGTLVIAAVYVGAISGKKVPISLPEEPHIATPEPATEASTQ